MRVNSETVYKIGKSENKAIITNFNVSTEDFNGFNSFLASP
jgi:hypothetical protein